MGGADGYETSQALGRGPGHDSTLPRPFCPLFEVMCSFMLLQATTEKSVQSDIRADKRSVNGPLHPVIVRSCNLAFQAAVCSSLFANTSAFQPYKARDSRMIALPLPPSCSYPHHEPMPFALMGHIVTDSLGGFSEL